MVKKITQKHNFIKYAPYLFILLIGFLVFLKPFGSGDELWNYNFARNIVGGNIPYKDFSIVQTPLSCYVSAAFMLLLGDGLFTFRVVTYILFISMAILIFHLCGQLTRNKTVAFFATLFVMSAHFLTFIYNYNYLTALVILVILDLEIKESESTGLNLVIGFLVGITILIKQNTGAFICIANFLICLRHCVKKPESKMVYVGRTIVSVVPFCMYAIYLWLCGAITDFYDYAIAGISTFTHRFTLLDFFVESSFFVPYALLIVIMYVMSIKKIIRKGTDFQISALLFSIAWTSIIYPLADASHVLLVLFSVVPLFMACYSFEYIKKKEIVYASILCVSTMFFLLTMSLPITAKFHLSDLNNYNGLIMEKETEDAIIIVDSYIEQKQKEGYKVRIADVSAAAYRIPLNEYEKNWDMLLVGNIGSATVEDLIQSDQPTLYLVMKDDSNYKLQDHYELIDYIKKHYSCVDQIAGFNVYAN